MSLNTIIKIKCFVLAETDHSYLCCPSMRSQVRVMEIRYLILFVFCLSGLCCGQDLHAMLNLKVKESQDAQSALDSYAHAGKMDQINTALDSVKDLWTVYFQEAILKDLNFTEDCINSTRAIFEREKIENFTITLPSSKIIPLIDAVGKQGAGLLTGNMIMAGAFDECFKYNYTGFCVAEHVNITPAVLNSMNVSLPSMFGYTIGLCVPKKCTPMDISLLINYTYLLQTNESQVECTDSKIPSYNAGAIIMLIVCAIFALLVLFGSVFDCIQQNAPIFFKKEEASTRYYNPSINDNETESEKAPLLIKGEKSRKRKCMDWCLELITAFSLFKTVPALLATKQSSTVITSLNGLRVISMFWVILGHTFFWILEGNLLKVDNIIGIRTLMERFTFQTISSAFFAVDSFFFLSGVLVAYLVLRQMEKSNGRFPFLPFYIHRYLRLTPTYVFVVFFAWFITPYISYGPGLSFGNPLGANCPRYWWTNFLYINNLYPFKLNEECLGWTWYLANDMQFYIISPLILIPIYHLFPVGLSVAAVFTLIGFVVTATLTGIFDFQANTFSLIAYGYENIPNTTVTYSDLIYIKPWNRVSGYMVGLILGYILYKKVHFKFGRRKNIFAYLIFWAIAFVIFYWITYGLYFTWHGHIPSKFENIAYVTFSRFGWTIALALIIFACHNGYGWFINSFLSMKIWTPLSRMTFNAYLMHPIVLTIVYGQFQTAMHYTDITIAIYAISFTVLSYSAAFFVCLCVELPLGTIEMALFKLFGSKPRESQRQVVRLKETKA